MDVKVEKILEKIKRIYPIGYEQFINEISHEPRVTFRVNTLTASNDILNQLHVQGFGFEKGQLPNSYVLTESPIPLSTTDAFSNGYIYIQGMSSMLASLVLEPSLRERVLDLCAAPGSKTSHIAALMANTGSIFAVEKNAKRVQKLRDNLDRLGVTNTHVLHADGFVLPRAHSELIDSFDTVLVDAPCSNEGYINLSAPASYKFWNPKKYTDMVWQQKGLLKAGFEMVKPGGILVYSTCTLSVEENEGVVNWLLEREDAEVTTIDSRMLEQIPWCGGILQWKTHTFHPDLAKTIRVIPDGIFRPFYIAKITKKG